MLRLLESTEELATFCRRLEKQIQLPSELGEIELPVTLLPNFEDQPGADRSFIILHGEAAYRPSQKMVVVNASTFFNLPAASALATLAHEIGHVVYEKATETRYNLGYSGLDEELSADALTCEWGFCEKMCEMRRDSYGNDYCELMRNRAATPQFVEKMGVLLQ